MSYDIIGDLHGNAEKLEALLARLGYVHRHAPGSAGVWRHPSRTAIFVGDFVGRGPHQRRTVELARTMVEDGAALAVMGNHEFNAIAWYLPDPEYDGKHLRTRWSRPDARTYREAALLPPELAAALHEAPLPGYARTHPPTDKPVFFGHYWLTGEPAPLDETVACVDYSAGKDGPLVAYRWDGEQRLLARNFCRTD